jgi:hypothetical protein
MALTVAMSGCRGSTGPVFFPAADEIPDVRDAYLYGSFMIDTSQYGVELVIQCNDSRSHVIPFSSGAPIQVVKISPSTCALREIIYLADNKVKGRKPMETGFWAKPFEIGGRSEARQATKSSDVSDEGRSLRSSPSAASA